MVAQGSAPATWNIVTVAVITRLLQR
jgi:hypothetical protein